ncbi:GntR family transcriptional regulator [Leucobacter komagatae]|uniref:GntR family transcriptional regulator n=1 Tax=Leucobacter komagatae TaxID=55969 RepID=A0A542Y7U7_9MICO|nr:GntR family transcriptional regulator [Leucobacter komagatae]TQL44156.1 GntR family transcriptional regulator [Leucobacter komagatae]
MRASDRAYATLLDEIQRGELAPGTVLGEVEQAARLGVSRTPAREAIGRLISNGLAAQLSPRVTVVSDFQADDIRALFEVRRALEENTARIAAAKGDPVVFSELAEAFAAAHPESGEVAADSYYDLIARFDEALDAAVGNQYFTSALRTIRTHLARARRLARDNRARLHASVAEHTLIAQAIAAGDGELAAHATHVHLHNALASILTSLATSGASGDHHSTASPSEGTTP